MKRQSSKSTGKLKGPVTGTSKFLFFLLGLFVIGLLVGGAYLAFGFYAKCQGQGMGACIWSFVNPFPDSYGRGAGEPMTCGPDEELDGALCYPKCQPGYSGVGPVCWQTCPSGFGEAGAFCAKPEAYGRGAGFPWELGDTAFSDSGQFQRCEAAYGLENCEMNGAIVYPKCQPNFHAVGCCICSPDCPAGMVDTGVSCTKMSYGRTAGVPLHACPENTEKDGLLCYPQCKPGFKGVGPVCWEE